METVDEVKKRMKERLGYMIINPSGGIKTKDGSILAIRSSLKRDTFEIAKEYIDFHLPENILNDIERISEISDGNEKKQNFDRLCNSIFIDLRNFIKHTENNANSDDPWYHLIEFTHFLEFKGLWHR